MVPYTAYASQEKRSATQYVCIVLVTTMYLTAAQKPRPIPNKDAATTKHHRRYAVCTTLTGGPSAITKAANMPTGACPATRNIHAPHAHRLHRQQEAPREPTRLKTSSDCSDHSSATWSSMLQHQNLKETKQHHIMLIIYHYLYLVGRAHPVSLLFRV